MHWHRIIQIHLNSNMNILGIESSCDETSAAIVNIDAKKVDVLSNVISSQIGIHQQFGGVVPEVAARSHAEHIIPIIDQAMQGLSDSSKDNIDLIAVTRGPGLMTSLLVGIQTAEALGSFWNIPVVGVNHLEGHVLSPLFEHAAYPPKKKMFPAIILSVSGGHTQLILMKGVSEYEMIGTTIDDAAGEAFDKVAKMMGREYPGGPVIDRLAVKGNPQAFDFPRPMLQFADYRFSFSGLKTAVKYAIRDLRSEKLSTRQKQDIAASFQKAVFDVLLQKTLRAVAEYGAKTVFLAGGVAASTELRNRLEHEIKEKFDRVNVLLVDRKYTGDNAAMIALAGYYEFLRQNKNPQRIEVDPKLRF